VCRIGGSQNERIDKLLAKYKLDGGARFKITAGEPFDGEDAKTSFVRLSQGLLDL
jgi:hypothetical protein